MTEKQKRVLAVHDISCMGKCSLTVALPIISATGIEVSCLPTAVLSTQTSGFSGYTFCDLTDNMVPTLNHWKSLGIQFEGIYTGYLGSIRQIGLMCQIIDEVGKDAMIFVDPVMGDDGKMYDNFNEEFASEMRKLVSKADVIFPNMTEAMLLLGKKYPDGPFSRRFIKETLRGLSALGPKKVVLSGVFFNRYDLGAAAYDADTDEVTYFFSQKVPGTYFGTGDIFGSTIVAGVMNGVPLPRAITIAVDFTQRSIARTYEAKTDVRFGVDFEHCIPKMLDDLNVNRA